MVEIKKGFYKCTQSSLGVRVGEMRRGQLPESYVNEILVEAQDFQERCNNFERPNGKKNGSCPEDCAVKKLVEAITVSQSAMKNLKPTWS